MSTKSILDYEEAKQRLQQLRNDQVVLGELVAKLRRFCDDIESKVKSFDEHDQRARTIREEAQNKASEIQELLEDLQGRGNETLKQLEEGMSASLVLLDEVKGRVEKDCESTIKHVTAAYEASEQSAREQQQSWVRQQDARFEEFAKQHHEEMEKVANAYERLKVVFDNVKIGAESLEKTVEEQGRSTKQAIDDMREDIHRQLAEGRNETAAKVEATREEIANLFEARSAAITEHIEGSLRSTQQELDRAQSELDIFRKKVRRQTMLLVIAIVAALGLSAFPLIHAFTRTNHTTSHQPTSPPPIDGARIVSEPRIWTDSTGRTTEAFFVGFDGENVQLKKADGKVYTISINQLNEKDQEFVRQHAPREQALPSGSSVK